MWISSIAPGTRTVGWSGLSRDAAEARAQTIKYMEKKQRETVLKKVEITNVEYAGNAWLLEKGERFLFCLQNCSWKRDSIVATGETRLVKAIIRPI